MECLVKCVYRADFKSEIIAGMFDIREGILKNAPDLLRVNRKDFPGVDYAACLHPDMPSIPRLAELLLQRNYCYAAIGFNRKYALLLERNYISVIDCDTDMPCEGYTTRVEVPKVVYLGVVRTKILSFSVKQTPALLSAVDVGDTWKIYLHDGIYYLPKRECDPPRDFKCSSKVYWDLAKLSGYYGAVYVNGMLTPFKTLNNQIIVERGDM